MYKKKNNQSEGFALPLLFTVKKQQSCVASQHRHDLTRRSQLKKKKESPVASRSNKDASFVCLFVLLPRCSPFSYLHMYMKEETAKPSQRLFTPRHSSKKKVRYFQRLKCPCLCTNTHTNMRTNSFPRIT